MNVETKELKVIADGRGWLTEVLNDGIKDKVGNIHFCISKPGAARGNHYHKRKIEWILVTAGNGKLTLEEIATKEKSELDLSGEQPLLVKVFPNIIHTIVNTGTEPMHLLIINSEKYSAEDPDTYRK